MMQQGMPGAMVPGASGPPTVLGVALEPGERVIYFYKPSYTADKAALWFLGVVTLIAVVGVVLIILAILHDSRNPRAQIVTNRRILEISGKGVVTSIPLADAMDLTAERQQGTYGAGGLIGIAISAAVTHFVNKAAENNPKTYPSYWKRTIAIEIIGRTQRLKVKTKEPNKLGPFLARCVFEPGSAEGAPPVPYEA
jgi:hypothetical protein